MITIERLEVDEGERLRKIRLASLQDAPDAFASTFQEAAVRTSDDWSEQIRVLPTFIAVVDGIDCGIVRAWAHPEEKDTALLISMWVARDARGTGLGEALIDAVANWSRSEGFAHLALDVNDDNEAAIALYARKDLKSTGESSTFPPPRDHIREHQLALDL